MIRNPGSIQPIPAELIAVPVLASDVAFEF
jgi:hypothetical protein